MRQLSRQQAINNFLYTLLHEGEDPGVERIPQRDQKAPKIGVAVGLEAPAGPGPLSVGQDGKAILPSKEEQRKEQNVSQASFETHMANIDDAEDKVKTIKGYTDTISQAMVPGRGGLVVAASDAISAGVANSLNSREGDAARDHLAASSIKNTVGSLAGYAGKGLTSRMPNIAPEVTAGAKKSIEMGVAGTATKLVGDNMPKVTKESYSNKRLKTIQEQVKRSISNLF